MLISQQVHAYDVARQCIMNSLICTDAGWFVGYKARYCDEVSGTLFEVHRFSLVEILDVALVIINKLDIDRWRGVAGEDSIRLKMGYLAFCRWLNKSREQEGRMKFVDFVMRRGMAPKWGLIINAAHFRYV